MYDTIYLPSQRRKTSFVRTGVGINQFRNYPGTLIEQPRKAYQNGIVKVNEFIQLSQPAVIAAAAPFSIPIRNASYNLNADPQALYRTPRSGLLWRVVGKEGHDVQNDILAPLKTVRPDLGNLVRNQGLYGYVSDLVIEHWNEERRWYVEKWREQVSSSTTLFDKVWSNERGEVAMRCANIMSMVPINLQYPDKLNEIWQRVYPRMFDVITKYWFTLEHAGTNLFNPNDYTQVIRSKVVENNDAVENGVKALHAQAVQEYLSFASQQQRV